MTIGTVSRYETAAGARVCVGAAQLAPHRRIDLAGWGADYVALSVHKIYAPYGAGSSSGAGTGRTPRHGDRAGLPGCDR